MPTLSDITTILMRSWQTCNAGNAILTTRSSTDETVQNGPADLVTLTAELYFPSPLGEKRVRLIFPHFCVNLYDHEPREIHER